MANTYSQIYVQLIFAVKGRACHINPKWKDELFKYITGIVSIKKQKMIAINGVSDHVHILVGLKPDMAISDLMRDIKSNSSGFINDKKWLKIKFHWQDGFSAFSYSRSQLSAVINYIRNQEKHHKKKTFREEYIGFLKKFDVDYDERYLFTFD